MPLVCQNPERCYSMACACPMAPEPTPEPAQEPTPQDDSDD